MKKNRHISSLLISCLISWTALYFVTTQISPRSNGALALTLFFPTFFIATMTTFSLIGFYIRSLLFQKELFYKQISSSIRQGVFLALITTFSFLLMLIDAFTWWSGTILIIIALILENYISKRDH